MDKGKVDTLQTTDDELFGSLELTHPLLQLLRFPLDGTSALYELQRQMRTMLDPTIEYGWRVQSVRALRPLIGKMDLVVEEAAKVAIDLLRASTKQFSSFTLLEQLSYAYLDKDGIGFEDRRFSQPPLQPLPNLIQTAESGKSVPAKRTWGFAEALGIWEDATFNLGTLSRDALCKMGLSDLRASLRMLLLYLIYGKADSFLATPAGRLDTLEDMGFSLWSELLSAAQNSPEFTAEDAARFGVNVQRAIWHYLRSKILRQSMISSDLSAFSAPPAAPSSGDDLVVIKGVIPPGSNQEDRDQLLRYERLRRPLPIARLPELDTLTASENSLLDEFPWAAATVRAIFDDLKSRRLFGGLQLGMVPTLFVGLPGCGKSRLARRIAETLKLTFLPLSLAGMGDSRAILGTARGWSSGQASPLVNLMLDRSCASALVMLDEIDKACSSTSNDVPPTSALLNLLEPENARAWYDSYLQTPCDLSKLLFVATANRLSNIPKTVISRLRIFLVPEPRPQDFRAIARGALVDIAQEWGLPSETLSELDTHAPVSGARNAREVKALVRHYLKEWAVASLGPDRVH